MPTDPVHLVRPRGRGPFVLTCEHASMAVPASYRLLGLESVDLADHIGWDIGAAVVARTLAAALDSPLVESAYSRLLIDCNRDLSDHDLIVAESHGVPIPGNQGIDDTERALRVATYYEPYHAAIEAALDAHSNPALLLSVHSFTPSLRGHERGFDVGVLYDEHTELANRLFDTLRAQDLAVRHNEPYSAFDGLIFSAKTHGSRRGVPYLEVEINNALLRTDADCAAFARRLVAALRTLLRSEGQP